MQKRDWTAGNWQDDGIELDKARAEIERLRAELTEIAHHYIDSELASREKRGMAQRAISNEQ